MLSKEFLFSLFHYLWFFKHLFLLQVISSLPLSIYFMTHFSIFKLTGVFSLFLQRDSTFSIMWISPRAAILLIPGLLESLLVPLSLPSSTQISTIIILSHLFSCVAPSAQEWLSVAHRWRLHSFAWFSGSPITSPRYLYLQEHVCFFPRLQNSSPAPASVLQFNLILTLSTWRWSQIPQAKVLSPAWLTPLQKPIPGPGCGASDQLAVNQRFPRPPLQSWVIYY